MMLVVVVMLVVVMLLTTSDVSSLGRNMSTLRLGKAQLLEDLRAHSALKDKISPCGEDNTVNLTFTYNHYEVLSVDEVEQTVTTVGSVALSWTDPDLTWDKDDYGGVDFILLNFNELWHPTIIVHNAVDPDYVMIDRVDTLMLGSDGVVNFVTPVFLKTTCNLNLQYYPFDDQTCNIVFFPNVDDVNFNIHSTITSGKQGDVTITGQWTTIQKSIVTSTVTSAGGLQVISFHMVIKRRFMYYVVCVLIPMLFTSSMTSMVFWIPPSSGEKISFLVTVFASNAVFLNFISGTMPSNMANNVLHMPRVTIFLILVNFQCMLAMILTIFVLRKYKSEMEDIETSHADVFSEQTDKNILSRKNEEDKMPPSSASYSRRNLMPAYLFRKLAFLKPRVAPSEGNKDENRHRTRKRCHGCCVRSSTWDIIFFCIFHLTSGPIYYLLFKM